MLIGAVAGAVVLIAGAAGFTAGTGGAGALSMPVAIAAAETMVDAALLIASAGFVAQVAGTTGGNQSNKCVDSLSKASNNKVANDWARQAGYEDAEDLKQAFVGAKNGAKFNIYKSKSTGEIIRQSIRENEQVSTGIFMK